MTDLANFISLNDNKVTGNVATLAFDIDLVGEAVVSDNEKAPKYRLFALSPRGKKIEVGAIWERENASQETYLSLSINTGYSRWYANLGRFPGQSDPDLLAVIPNDFLNNPDRRK